MTWYPNIPTASQSPAGSQPFILANDQKWPVVFAENHVAMNSNNQGDHEEVIFRKLSADQEVTGDWGTFYCKESASATGAKNQLFYRTRQFVPNQTNLPQQITFTQVNNSGANQQTFLMGGFLIYMGSFSLMSGGGGSPTVQDITVSPNPTSIKMALANFNTQIPNANSNRITTRILSSNSFRVNIAPDGAAAPYTIKYIAIGVQ